LVIKVSAYKIFKKLYKKKAIEGLYEEKIKSKPSTGIDGVNNVTFEKYLQDNIDIIQRKVNNDTYNFTAYKEKLISKGKGKHPRAISIPTLRDKLTLALLHNLLAEVYENEIEIEIVQTVISKVKESMKTLHITILSKLILKNFTIILIMIH
jgi:RNA-directed DNA polymerase